MRLLAQADSEHHGGLSWSPDSMQLAFVKWIDLKGKTANIWIVSLSTAVVHPFTTDGKENTQPSWSPDGKWIAYISRRGPPSGSHRV